MNRICIHCEEEFDDALPHNRKGKINECGSCARETVTRYVGMTDVSVKSGAGTTIFRNPTAINIVSAVIKAQNTAGFNANLGLGSTTSTFGESADI